jgi:hypothetical protein
MPSPNQSEPSPLRKLGVAKLVAEIRCLRDYQDHAEDFHLRTSSVLETLRELLARLDVTDKEHAACEILRQVRDSFYDGGWNAYRDEKTRQGVIELLERHLISADVVRPATAEQSCDELLALGLRPVRAIPGLFSFSDRE